MPHSLVRVGYIVFERAIEAFLTSLVIGIVQPRHIFSQSLN
jgi:hypothetical protein